MATTQQPIAEAADRSKRIVLGLSAVFLVYLSYSYFYQIMLSALPKIAASLNGMSIFPWASSIPNLGLAFSMLIVGKISDIYGRRLVLFWCLAICLVGAIWLALSPTFIMFIVARTFLSIGQGGLAPLCFSVLGDMFDPGERGKWAGMLNIPAGAFAMIGPTMGGWFVDHHKWRLIFWCGMPLLVISAVMVLFALPAQGNRSNTKIDFRGVFLAAVASSTMILAFSLAGTMYAWGSSQVLGLLAASIIFWILFIQAEARAEAPILNLQILKNRTFIIIASSCLFSAFGMSGLMIYYPLLLQGVQGVSATMTGTLMMPGNMLMNFLGVLAGILIAMTKRYKWMFLAGYGLTLAVMIGVMFFNPGTPHWLSFCAFTLSGIGMGSIPTVNTLVAQYAVPKKLLGVATSVLYFSVMLGMAIAPAILGSAMNMEYNRSLKTLLPHELLQSADAGTIKILGDPNALLSRESKDALWNTISKMTNDPQPLMDKTVAAITASMGAGLRIIFLIGAVTMALTFLIICTIPKVLIDSKSD